MPAFQTYSPLSTYCWATSSLGFSTNSTTSWALGAPGTLSFSPARM